MLDIWAIFFNEFPRIWHKIWRLSKSNHSFFILKNSGRFRKGKYSCSWSSHNGHGRNAYILVSNVILVCLSYMVSGTEELGTNFSSLKRSWLCSWVHRAQVLSLLHHLLHHWKFGYGYLYSVADEQFNSLANHNPFSSIMYCSAAS